MLCQTAALLKVNPNPGYRGKALYIYIGHKIAQFAPLLALPENIIFPPNWPTSGYITIKKDPIANWAIGVQMSL